ncbi:MAG: formamidase [Bradyrhizobium sp.]|nr:formamidase [Bradyrhizobium sp.]
MFPCTVSAPPTDKRTIEGAEYERLGGLNKSPEGIVIGLVQLQLPVVVTKADLARQTERIHGTNGRADEIITAEVRPDLVREARIHWGVENNIYQLWHPGYVAVKGGAMDCPYTFMQDMVAGTFRLPWEDQVKVTDGTSCGFPVPTRIFGPKTAKAAE